jgi:hypothetical protein
MNWPMKKSPCWLVGRTAKPRASIIAHLRVNPGGAHLF